MGGTTERELLWVHEYLTNGFNAGRAARAVGYADTTSKTEACTWVQATREASIKPHLWDLVHEVLDKKLSHLDATEERIIQEYVRIAMFDPSGLYGEDGELLPVHEMPEDTRRAIGAVDTSSRGFMERVIKIKLNDKRSALSDLARIRGMFNDKVEVKGFAELLAEITKKAGNEPLVDEGAQEVEE